MNKKNTKCKLSAQISACDYFKVNNQNSEYISVNSNYTQNLFLPQIYRSDIIEYKSFLKRTIIDRNEF